MHCCSPPHSLVGATAGVGFVATAVIVRDAITIFVVIPGAVVPNVAGSAVTGTTPADIHPQLGVTEEYVS